MTQNDGKHEGDGSDKAGKKPRQSKTRKAAKPSSKAASKAQRSTPTAGKSVNKSVAKSTSKSTAKPPSKPIGKATRSNDDDARALALAIANVALDLKALKVEIIDVRGKVDYSDFVVVMSGRSDRQVAALARNIESTLDQSHGARCIGVEGMPQATWLLMDYGDVIVHIFHQDTRGYYDLETLWLDAARVSVD